MTELEAALMNQASVLDCAVRARSLAEGSATQIVAYIVPLTEFSEEAVCSAMRAALPDAPMPDHYVLLSSLPLREDGTLDEEALARLAVVDEPLAMAWKEKLLSLPEVQEANVVIEARTPKLALIHLDDLLANGAAPHALKAGKSAAAQSDSPERGYRKAAISHGEPFANPDHVLLTMQAALARAAERMPPRGVTYVQADGTELSHSYRELLEQAERILRGLRSLGLRAGDKIIFQLPQNQDFIAAFWACVLGGFVSAPISIAPAYAESNSTVRKLHHCWELLDHPLILAGQSIAGEVRRAGKLLGAAGWRVETIENLRAADADHDWHESRPDDICLILFTSGSTGLPKGVLQSHRSLLHRSAGTAQVTRLDAADGLLNWFPLDHVGGIVMSHLMALYVCARQILVPTEMILEQPLQWLDLIERYRATATWAPNFAFALINEREGELRQRRRDLSSMRFVLNGGEAIVPKTARRFLRLLAEHGLRADAMHPSWGMSETCSGVAFSDRCTLDIVRDDDSFVEVGAPIPGISFRIVDGRDQMIEEGRIGRLQVKGLPVTSGYYKNPDLDRESFSSDGWFNTGDLAVLNEGRLTITGRSKDVIIINGANFFSHEIESVVEEVAGVEASYTAAFAVRSAGDDTDRLCIIFHALVPEGAEQFALIARIREALATKAGVKPAFVIPVERAEVSKTAIGKIERSTLRRRFEAGEFDAVVRRIEVATQSSVTVPNWFFRKAWTAQQPRLVDHGRLRGHYLVFADQHGLAPRLRGEIGERAAGWIEVTRGEAFARLGESRYSLNPAEPSHYGLLSAALAQQRMEPDIVLHMWTYGGDREAPARIGELTQRDIAQAQQAGTYSVLRLAQFLEAAHSSRHIRFFVASSRAQATCEQDLVDCGKTTLLGLVKTISLEMPFLDCRQIDLEGRSPEADARWLVGELAIRKSRMEVAYRGDRRLQAGLSQVDMLAQPVERSPIAEGGLYLITGGLGGVGTCLAEFLGRRYGAKLLLLGRTELSGSEEPDRREKMNGADAPDPSAIQARRARNFKQLESSGADFLYRSADIRDLERLRAMVSEAEQHWNRPLAGIFHLAGEGNLERHWKVMDRHWIRAETTDTFEWMFGPKVYGTRVLFELIEDRPDVLFVAFSSVFSFFGSATSSGYSAASSFLDAYCEARHCSTHPRTYCFDWTVWDEIGMSEAGPAAVGQAFQKMGYSLLASAQALDSMVAALLRGQHQLAIGLDISSPHVQKQALQPPAPLLALSAYYTLRENARASVAPGVSLSSTQIADRFGARTSCRLVHVSAAALAEMYGGFSAGRGKAVSKRLEPATEAEHRIARVWREVLGLSSVSMADRFFELGGDSLLALRVVNRLREIFGVGVSLRDLFEMPTIAEFAASVALRQGESSGDSEAQQSATPAPASAAADEAPSDDRLLAMMDQLPDEEIDALLKRVSQA